MTRYPARATYEQFRGIWQYRGKNASWCAKNATYADLVRESFLTGNSASEFPDEHYEATWPNRFTVDQLKPLGRSGLGLM